MAQINWHYVLRLWQLLSWQAAHPFVINNKASQEQKWTEKGKEEGGGRGNRRLARRHGLNSLKPTPAAQYSSAQAAGSVVQSVCQFVRHSCELQQLFVGLLAITCLLLAMCLAPVRLCVCMCVC